MTTVRTQDGIEFSSRIGGHGTLKSSSSIMAGPPSDGAPAPLSDIIAGPPSDIIAGPSPIMPGPSGPAPSMAPRRAANPR